MNRVIQILKNENFGFLWLATEHSLTDDVTRGMCRSRAISGLVPADNTGLTICPHDSNVTKDEFGIGALYISHGGDHTPRPDRCHQIFAGSDSTRHLQCIQQTELGVSLIFHGDARSIPYPDDEFHCIVTSPPYFGLRLYGDNYEEIGLGSVDKYFSDMERCAVEWRRVLHGEGLLWLNLGDTASGSGGAGGDYNRGGSKEGRPRYRQGETDRSRMQWLNIPHRVLEVFVSNGWLFRSCVTWDKGVLRPEDLSHARRPGVSGEFIFMLAKDRSHRFYADRLVERGNVWHFPPARGRQHLAPFPMELPRRCIPLSTQVGESVLDPFAGSGTTIQAAAELGRLGVGIDLYAAED